MLGSLRIVWTSALTGLDKKVLGFQDGWTFSFQRIGSIFFGQSLFQRIGFGWFFRTSAFPGFKDFRFSRFLDSGFQ
jgi:hypothetical protein